MYANPYTSHMYWVDHHVGILRIKCQVDRPVLFAYTLNVEHSHKDVLNVS